MPRSTTLFLAVVMPSTASSAGDALFVDPAKGKYRIRQGSPALRLGSKNFRMDDFGVTSPALRAIARTPAFPDSALATAAHPTRSNRAVVWLGAKVRDIHGQGEMSAFGTPGENGVLILEVPADSPLKAAGLRPNDVILSVNDQPPLSLVELLRWASDRGPLKIAYLRNQQRNTLTVKLS